jgi:ATP-grasp ribosomal peptide maturase
MNDSDDPAVLILTYELDMTVDLIVRELARRAVPVFRFNTPDFPQKAQVAAQIGHEGHDGWAGRITAHGRSVSLENVRSIWYRRPRRFETDPNLTEIETNFALNESRFGLGGILRSLNALWVNSAESDAAANYKPWQLRAAAACGLTIPPTLITNDPAEVDEFRRYCPDGVIYKTLSGAPRSDDYVASIYTTSLDADLEQDPATTADILAGVGHCTCLFQANVPKRADLRVTIVGDAVFSVAIDNDHDALDFRKLDVGGLRHEVHPLPAEVENSLKRLTRMLGLEFGAVDLALTPEGNYVFLEINPNGQWGWIEQMTGVPIASAMADLLAGGQKTPPVGAASTKTLSFSNNGA